MINWLQAAVVRAAALKIPTEQGKNKMTKKELFCIHDKKSKTYDGFMIFNNLAEAIRAFQISCEKNEVFQKWPEDFEFVKVIEFKYDEQGLNSLLKTDIVVAQAKDYIKIPDEETAK